ncbi:MAG: hypothetical protein ACRDK4_05125 [Solirubrobacteraceae bacterium]
MKKYLAEIQIEQTADGWEWAAEIGFGFRSGTAASEQTALDAAFAEIRSLAEMES